MNLSEWADRVRQAHIQVTLLANFDSTELVVLDNVLEVIALTCQWIPKLETSFSLVSLAHHVDHVSIRHTVSENYVGLVAALLPLVDVREVVGEDDSVLFIVTTTEVKELLSRRP